MKSFVGKRFGAALAALGFVLILFLSSVYAGHAAGFDCSGEDCLICEVLEQMALLSRGLALPAFFLAFFMILFSGCVCLAEDGAPLFQQDTPVRLKVRMND